jgi:hypothetical protein
MEVHVKIDPVPKGLDGGDDPGRKHAPGHNLEVTDRGPEGAAAEIAEETALVLEEDPQHFPLFIGHARKPQAFNPGVFWHGL